MHVAYDTFDNISAGTVVKHFPYEKGRISNVIARFDSCEESAELHRILANKAGCPWADNKEMFAVELWNIDDTEPCTVYVMFWDGFMKIGLKGTERK